MNTHPQWPGLSAVIHHTIHRHNRIAVAEVAETLGIPSEVICQWAQTHGITLYDSASGIMIERAAIDSALTRRSPQSRAGNHRAYRQ